MGILVFKVKKILSSYKELRDFSGGPVVKTSPSNAGGMGSAPGRRIKIPCVSWPKNQNTGGASDK